jgi:hypothetical protein
MFSLKETLARIAGRKQKLDDGRAMRKADGKRSVEQIKAAIARLEQAEGDAAAEIERLTAERPTVVLDGEYTDLKALDDAIAAAALQKEQARALADSLAEPLAKAEYDEEQARRQALLDKVGPTLTPLEPTFLSEYAKARKALVALIELRLKLWEVYDAAAERLPEGKQQYDIPGQGLLLAMNAVSYALGTFPTIDELRNDYLGGAYERRQAEEARRRQEWYDGREDRERAEREEEDRKRKAREEWQRKDEASPYYIPPGTPYVLTGDPSTHDEQLKQISAEARRARGVEQWVSDKWKEAEAKRREANASHAG